MEAAAGWKLAGRAVTFILPFHILAGLIGIVSGAIALYVIKGANVHRKSGIVFVYAMAFLSITGAMIATSKGQRLNAMQGIFTFYLVMTALLTVREPSRRSRLLEIGGLVLALILCAFYFRYGLAALNSDTGKFDGYPPPLFFIFGGVSVLAIAGDARMLIARGLQGTKRLARHLWRMCFAMFIATGSFFLGQMQVFPKAIRNPALLSIPVIASLLIMFFWLWRVRIRRMYKGIQWSHATAPE